MCVSICTSNLLLTISIPDDIYLRSAWAALESTRLPINAQAPFLEHCNITTFCIDTITKYIEEPFYKYNLNKSIDIVFRHNT